MNTKKLISGKTLKKIKNFCVKGVFSLLLAAFFVGGIAPMYSVFSGNEEFSGTEISYADHEAGHTGAAPVATPTAATTSTTDTKVATNEQIMKDAQNMKMSQDLKIKISEFAALMISIFTPILAILVKLIESLMSDSYIMGTNGADAGLPIAQVLYELWIVFRDIMNYLFILILLFFAFMNVIAPIADNDNFALKTVLPKMIMAIVVINMTWFGARVVFDVVDVSARVVFGLPQAIMEGKYGDALDPTKNKCTINQVAESKFATIEGLCYPGYISLDSPEEKKEKKDAAETAKAAGKTQEVDLTQVTKENAKAELENLVTQQGDLLATNNCAADAEKTETLRCKDIQNKITALEKLIKDETIKWNASVDYGPVTVYWSDFNYSRFNQGTIAPMFAFGIMQIQNLPRIAQTDYQAITKEGTGWSTLVINILVSLVIMIILLVLFALMVINLFFRVIVLWVNIIFSPFYGLLIFQEQLSIPDSSSDYLGLAAFIKHAFAPVIMGIPLVIGFIMISVGKQYAFVAESGSMGIDTPMIDNVSNLHQLFYYVLSIVVLWVGGVKAIEATSSEFVQSNMIDPIKGGVESAAKFVATAPMYINFIPVAGKDGMADMNLRQLTNMTGEIGRLRDQKSSQERQDIMGASDATKFTTKYSDEIGDLKRDDSSKTKDILESLSKSGGGNSFEIKDSDVTHKTKLINILSGLSNKEEAQAVLQSFGAKATLKEAETLLVEAKKVKGVTGSIKKSKQDADKKPETGEPKKVKNLSDVTSYNETHIRGTSTQQEKKNEVILNVFNEVKNKDDIKKVSELLQSKIVVGNKLDEIKEDKKDDFLKALIKRVEAKKLENPEKDLDKNGFDAMFKLLAESDDYKK